MTAPLVEKSLGDYLGLFESQTRPIVVAQLNSDDVEGCVCFLPVGAVNGHAGVRVNVIFGPGCQRVSLDEIKDTRLHDAAAGCELVPVYYYKKDAQS